MRIIKISFIALFLLVGIVNPAAARVNIDLNLSLFPELVPVPGYPVYYAPDISSNYFFYDGRYWLFDGDEWYESAWYNGPWEYVERDYVPVYVLRIPVRYYRRPPPYFRGWYYDAPPRWGHRWGHDWERRHHGWDQWDRRRTPALAPLPTYQRHYAGDRYPDRDRQRYIHEHNYRQPSRDADDHRRDVDRTERIREPVQPDRRDHMQHRPDEIRRVIPQPQSPRYDNSASPDRERNQRFDDDRARRNQPPPQSQGHDNRQKNESRDQLKSRDGGRDRMRDNGVGRNNDRGEPAERGRRGDDR